MPACICVGFNIEYGFCRKQLRYFVKWYTSCSKKSYKQKFWDVDKKHWAFEAIAELAERGAINGFDDGTFRGQATLTRAEAATLLWRAFQFGNDDKTTAERISKTSENTDVIPSLNSSTVNDSTNDILKELPDDKENNTKHKVETLEKIPKDVDDFTFTKSGEIYYIKDNKLFKLFNGNITELFDGSSDYYEEVTVGVFLERIKENGGYYLVLMRIFIL